MRIQLIDEDLQQGIACDPSECPVARGLYRITGRLYLVMGDTIRRCWDRMEIDAPQEVVAFVDTYDNWEPGHPKPEPIAFELADDFLFMKGAK